MGDLNLAWLRQLSAPSPRHLSAPSRQVQLHRVPWYGAIRSMCVRMNPMIIAYLKLTSEGPSWNFITQNTFTENFTPTRLEH